MLNEIKYLRFPVALLVQAGELGLGDQDLKLFMVSQAYAAEGEFFPGKVLLGQAMNRHPRRIAGQVERLEKRGFVRKRYPEGEKSPNRLGLDFGPLWHHLRDVETCRMPERSTSKPRGRPKGAKTSRPRAGYFRVTKHGTHWVKPSQVDL